MVAITTDKSVAHKAVAGPIRQLERVSYRAVWRSRHLIILPLDCHPFRQSVSAVMEGDRDRLLACLKRSPIQCIFLSRELPGAESRFWADLGRRVGRPVYLRSYHRRQFRTGWWHFRSERALNTCLAAVLLLLLSPVMLGLFLVLLITKGEVFERSWQIGYRGKLFVGLRFAGFESVTSLKSGGNAGVSYAWLRQLPQLVNIVRGDVGFSRRFIDLDAFGQGRVLLDS